MPLAFRRVPDSLSLSVQYWTTKLLDDLELLMKKVSPIESRKLRIAMKVISCIPELDCLSSRKDNIIVVTRRFKISFARICSFLKSIPLFLSRTKKPTTLINTSKSSLRDRHVSCLKLSTKAIGPRPQFS